MKEDSPPTGTCEKILVAARELFAERGFKGTTTAAIAQQAGVNEALIYRHFPAKRDLYTAILRAKIEDETSVKLVQAAECQGLPVDEALRLFAQRYLLAQDPVFLRLYYQSALERHELAGRFYDQFVKRFIGGVEQLFQRGVEEGSFRPMDCQLAAQAFTGMFRSYALTKEMFPNSAIARPDDEIVATYCELFLQGIQTGN